MKDENRTKSHKRDFIIQEFRNLIFQVMSDNYQISSANDKGPRWYT